MSVPRCAGRTDSSNSIRLQFLGASGLPFLRSLQEEGSYENSSFKSPWSPDFRPRAIPRVGMPYGSGESRRLEVRRIRFSTGRAGPLTASEGHSSDTRRELRPEE